MVRRHADGGCGRRCHPRAIIAASAVICGGKAQIRYDDGVMTRYTIREKPRKCTIPESTKKYFDKDIFDFSLRENEDDTSTLYISKAVYEKCSARNDSCKFDNDISTTNRSASLKDINELKGKLRGVEE